MSIDLLGRIDFENIIKLLVIGLELIYCLFAFIMIRQVKLMDTSFTTKIGPLFLGFAQIHFLFSIGVVLLSLLLY